MTRLLNLAEVPEPVAGSVYPSFDGRTVIEGDGCMWKLKANKITFFVRYGERREWLEVYAP